MTPNTLDETITIPPAVAERVRRKRSAFLTYTPAHRALSIAKNATDAQYLAGCDDPDARVLLRGSLEAIAAEALVALEELDR